MFKKKGIKLYVLISLLILFVVSSATTINWIISVNTYKKSISEKHLNHNYSYAKKLTSSTMYQLNYMLKNIIGISEITGHHDADQDDIDTWFKANDDQLNSLFITDQDGIVQYVNSEESGQVSEEKIEPGMTLASDTFKRVLQEKKPSISDPYYGSTNQLITLISAPIFDTNTGIFQGVVGGTIHMEKTNVLKSLLSTHEYADLSYVFVVDESGKLIYHPDEKRLGEDVSSNKVVQHVMNKEVGSMVIENSEGIEFFAGYAFVESTGWGIIAQTPTSIIDEGISEVFRHIVLVSLPFIIVVLIVGGLLVAMITKPIQQLVSLSEQTVYKDKIEEQEIIKIKSPIYEVRYLYQQIIDHLRTLNKQARIDGLTEIANRRTFDTVIKKWINEQISFSLIMLDIDFFKKVNDKHGHLVGDEVLKFLAREMVKLSEEDDMCFRYGGEEFGILVKNKGTIETYELAEKLRKQIASMISPSGETIKISLGVTTFQHGDSHAKELLTRADAALYHSKQTGRNKTSICNDNRLKMEA